MTADLHLVIQYVEGKQYIHTCPFKHECWYTFTILYPTLIMCLWTDLNSVTSSGFQHKIDIKKSFSTTQPPMELSPYIYNTGPYIIKNIGQLQVFFNPSQPLKQVELLIPISLSMQVNISAIKPTCSPFLDISYTGWLAWLHEQTLISPERSRRDVTGLLGTGLGALNSIVTEVLANKIRSTTSNLYKLDQPSQSSLLALGTNQWLLSDILPQWERISEKDHQLIMRTLGATQMNVCLALSCVQAQLWIQSTVEAIIREGEGGTLPAKIQEIIWNNMTKFKREFQFWWQLVNFTYNPTDSKATAFVLKISYALVYTVYPIIALELNHNGTVLYSLEHKVRAQQKGNKWQTIDIDVCVVRGQWGFICESNTVKAQDIILDTEQNICHFERHPDETPEAIFICVGNQCICMRTLCHSISIDNTTVEIYVISLT